MLKDRLRTSAILISIVGCLLYLDSNYSISNAEGLWLLPVLLFFALGTAHDASTLLGSSGRPINRRAAIIGTLLVTLAGYLPNLWPLMGESYPTDCPVGKLGWIIFGATAAIFVALAVEMMQYGKPRTQGEASEEKTALTAARQKTESNQSGERALERICNASFVSLYVGLPMALLVSLRSLGSGNWGLAALLTTIAVTKSTDAGAYFTGKAIGRKKLIPRLSPGKTWEGSIGGICTATLVAYACLRWLFPAIATDASPPLATPSLALLSDPIPGALCLGVLLGVTGMLGDLAESLVKRECGAKDSGSLLPGLGGVWDVSDSLIVAAVPAFLCFAAGIAG
ncbi:phosphatidate cytidylyltransferase [Rhodopirellula sp.]|nr:MULTISPECIES: phosphatidate cytidylyltransferase [Pirellulaceae]MDB4338639.1 phosphatidate cytidylyltransferase [Rubripirellula sp.]MDB4678812.1 phosphatidate cytidylyltransferase [Rhodopirellula sp.]